MTERDPAEYHPEDFPEELRWKKPGPPPPSWWAHDKDGKLTRVYRSYADYCDD